MILMDSLRSIILPIPCVQILTDSSGFFLILCDSLEIFTPLCARADLQPSTTAIGEKRSGALALSEQHKYTPLNPNTPKA